MFGQAISIICGDQYLDEPARLYRRIRELQGSPFHYVQLVPWNTKYPIDHPLVIEVVETAVQVAHECGLQAGLTIAANALSEFWYPFLLDHPQAFERAVIQLQTRVREGRIESAAPNVFAFPQIDSRNEWLTWPVFGGVLGAFTRSADSSWELVALGDVEAIHQGFQDPGLEHLYARDLPHGTRRRLQRRIRAAVDLPDGTEVLLYAAWDHRGACDISHPAMKAQFRKMLTAYRRVPLDGIAWHEPIKMAYNQGHALGPYFLDRYRQEYGRDLVEDLVLLDEDDPRGRHVMVRLAYGQLIGRIVQELIDMMCATARDLWGENVFIGNQCMWQGGGSITDLRANGGDYFALHRNMSAAYVNTAWGDSPRTSYYTDILAASMRKRHSSSRCYSMSMGWDPVEMPEPVSYYNRIMAMLRVNWNCMGYGDGGGPTPHLFPHDSAWHVAQEGAHLIEACDRLLGRLERRPSLGVWHGVEGMLGARHWTNWLAKAAYLNLSQTFVENNLAFDFIPTEAIEAAVVADGRAQMDKDAYSTVLVPYAATMTPRMWDQLQAFIAAGVRVVFLGPPPTQLTDGTPILEQFSELIGSEIQGERAYWQAFEQQYGRIESAAREPYVFAPLPTVADERYIRDAEGHSIAVKGLRENVVYMPASNPADLLLTLVGEKESGRVEAVNASMLWQLYEDGDEQCLILCARRGRVLGGSVRFAGRTITLSGGARLAMIHQDSRGAIRCAAEGSTTVEVDGRPIDVAWLSVADGSPRREAQELTLEPGPDRVSIAQDSRTQVRHQHMVCALPTYATRDSWEARAEQLRRRILVSAGLWPMPEKRALNPHITGRIEHEDYTIENVYFESTPGFFVTGNLYRPRGRQGPFPGIVCPHGHFRDGRLTHSDGCSVPARCISFARQGYVAFAYDMIGYNDSGLQAPEMVGHMDGKPLYRKSVLFDRKGFLWGISLMGMQLWNSIRVVDFLLSLPAVDPQRIACTGASGGGTQTFMLAAIDKRVKVAAPVNRISAHFQGGCMCENAPNLRLDGCDVEFAAMMAPRPLLMVSATGDWTRSTPDVEFPAVQEIYRLHEATANVATVQVDAGHNYNQESREAVYAWFGKWLPDEEESLQQDQEEAQDGASMGRSTGAEPTVGQGRQVGLSQGSGQGSGLRQQQFKEQPFAVEAPERMLVFADGKLPATAVNGHQLMANLIRDAEAQIQSFEPVDAISLQAYREVMGTAYEYAMNALQPQAHDLQVERVGMDERDGYCLERLIIGRKGIGERMPALLFAPEQASGGVLVVHPGGKDGLAEGERPGPLVTGLLDLRFNVLAIDAFGTGELARVQRDESPYDFLAFNRTDTALQVQDILTGIAYLKAHTGMVHLVGLGLAGLWCLLARGLTSDIANTIADAARFDYNDDNEWVERLFVPQVRRAGDFRTAAALAAPGRLLIHNVSASFPAQWVRRVYAVAGASEALHIQSRQADVASILNALTSAI